MRKIRIFNVLIALLITFSLSSCNVKQSNRFIGPEEYIKKGEIAAYIREAFYSQDEVLTNAEGKSEKSMVIVVGINNDTDFAKKVTTVRIHSVQTEDKKDIIKKDLVFDLNDEIYVLAKSQQLVRCDIEEDQILLDTILTTLTSEISVDVEGAIKDAPKPSKANTGYTMSITEALFTTTNAINGKIAIRNNFSENKTPKLIKFDLFTENNIKVNTKKIKIINDLEIASSEVLVIDFIIPASEVNIKITTDKQFDTFIPKFNISWIFKI